MQRGELWDYVPAGLPRHRRMLLVSSDGINDSARSWLLAIELVEEDPGDILAVPVPERGWLYAGSISRVYRGWLTERVASPDPEVMERVDGALRAALDL